MIRFDAFIEDMGLDGKDDILALYTDFVEEVSELLSLLDALEQYDDLPTLLKITHNIKGVCANLYIDDFAHVALTYEDKLKAASEAPHTLDQSVHRKMIDELLHQLSNSKQEISDYFGLSLTQ